jgi:hypothetical protein
MDADNGGRCRDEPSEPHITTSRRTTHITILHTRRTTRYNDTHTADTSYNVHEVQKSRQFTRKRINSTN